MEMKQVLLGGGQVKLVEVPQPQPEFGCLLIQLYKSCISTGTELAGIKNSGIPLWRRALNEPHNVKKVTSMLLANGFSKVKNLVQERISTENPIGYSAAGVVVGVGQGVNNFKIGDRVACAGAQYAHHAEIVRVPKNLVVHIPESLTFEEAAPVALGSIALQGVRRLNPTLGESFAVIGLGVIGQLTAQILKANGCRVLGIDIDPVRIDLAKAWTDWVVYADPNNQLNQIQKITGGDGLDGVVVTASSKSNEIVSAAFQICRRKGRVVVVGDVGLRLNRSDMYQKELDFLISTSYGPGRYDSTYEDEGFDYPLGYVRWTENRNMGEFLRLVSAKCVDVKSLITHTYPIDNAVEAYEQIQAKEKLSLITLLDYPTKDIPVESIIKVSLDGRALDKNIISLGVIGVGNFAKEVHLPNISKLMKDFHIRAVVAKNGHNALAISKKWNADYCSTNYLEVLSDSQIDAVVISTRHNTHAKIALDALRFGKHVLVEKPLVLNVNELSEIESFYQSEAFHKPILMTGYNRRFSPFARMIKEILTARANPIIINYRMNAGYVPLDHWVHGADGGGRNLGEACHIYDLFTYFIGSKFKSVSVKSITPSTKYYASSDNFIAVVTFEDGSIASLTYTSMGNSKSPKEEMEIYADGEIISMSDYRKLTVSGKKEISVTNKVSQKGHFEEVKEFSAAIKGKIDWPIELWEQMQAAKIAFEIEKKLVQI